MGFRPLSVANGDGSSLMILWNMVWTWRPHGDQLPKDHPAVRFARKLKKLVARGYDVSNLDDGKGFLLKLQRRQTTDDVIRDVQECLGWKLASPPRM